MPTVRPFRALRYDTAAAGPLADLVAPPYDVISDEARLEYLARSPYNVVHLTLPDSEEQAGRDLAAWRASGVLAEEPERYWWIAQDYVGPDGVARTREGFAASVPATPYERGRGAPARANPRRPEGRSSPPSSCDADAARADLPSLRRRSAARAAGRRAAARRRRGRRAHARLADRRRRASTRRRRC